MREIILDTETTGFDPAAGHRIVEIACIEVENGIFTGREFRRYLNPERDMPEEAFAVHGLSAEFLANHKTFGDEVDGFLDFVGDLPFVIHNAEFDIRFLNAELTACGRAPLAPERAQCSVQLARRKFPGAAVSLDALCKRFGIDNSHRTKHGALLDCHLLAEVYVELLGGRQQGLGLATKAAESAITIQRVARAPRPHQATADELAAHADLLGKLKQPIWHQA